MLESVPIVLCALVLLTLGSIGALTPFATGPSPVYCGSGYSPAKG